MPVVRVLGLRDPAVGEHAHLALELTMRLARDLGMKNMEHVRNIPSVFLIPARFAWSATGRANARVNVL